MLAGSGATLGAHGAIVLIWKAFSLDYNCVYIVSGGIAALIGLVCLLAWPKFEALHPQLRHMVLRRRYWL